MLVMLVVLVVLVVLCAGGDEHVSFRESHAACLMQPAAGAPAAAAPAAAAPAAAGRAAAGGAGSVPEEAAAAELEGEFHDALEQDEPPALAPAAEPSAPPAPAAEPPALAPAAEPPSALAPGPASQSIPIDPNRSLAIQSIPCHS